MTLTQNTNITDHADGLEPPEICYKYLWRNPNNQLVSGVVVEKDWVTVYTPFQIVTPRVGKIFVFSNLEFAIRFYLESIGEHYEIWLAHGSNLQMVRNILPYRDLNNQGEDFWKCINSKDEKIQAFWREMAIYPAPFGSRLSDSLVLVEQVDIQAYVTGTKNYPKGG